MNTTQSAESHCHAPCLQDVFIFFPPFLGLVPKQMSEPYLTTLSPGGAGSLCHSTSLFLKDVVHITLDMVRVPNLPAAYLLLWIKLQGAWGLKGTDLSQCFP